MRGFLPHKRQLRVLIEYAVEADPADDKVVPKEGCIKFVERNDESKVYYETAIKRTEASKIEIEQY